MVDVFEYFITGLGVFRKVLAYLNIFQPREWWRELGPGFPVPNSLEANGNVRFFLSISGMASLNKHPVVFREGDWVPMGVFNMGSCRFLRREPLELFFEATCRTAHQWTVLAMPSTTPRPSDRIPTHQDGGHISLELSFFSVSENVTINMLQTVVFLPSDFKPNYTTASSSMFS